MRTHFSRSSGLDGMPLTCDALRERSVLGLVCLDKWVRFSALHMIVLWRGLHTLTPGPDNIPAPFGPAAPAMAAAPPPAGTGAPQPSRLVGTPRSPINR